MVAPPTINELKDRSPSLDSELKGSEDWLDEVNLRLITDMDALHSFLGEAKQATIVANDLETSGLNPERHQIVGIALACSRHEGVYIPLRHRRDAHLNLDPDVVLPLIQELCLAVMQLFFNAKFDVTFYEQTGILIPSWRDVSIDCFMLNTNRKKLGLKNMSLIVLGRIMAKIESVVPKKKGGKIDFSDSSPQDAYRYGAGDAVNTYELYHVLEPVRTEQATIYKIETAAAEAVRRMEINRVQIDLDYCRKMWSYLDAEIRTVKADIFKRSGVTFDIDSPKQCGQIIFDRLQIPNQKKRTKSGQYDTSADHFNVLAEQYPICKLILTARSLAKSQSTYVTRLIEAGEADARGAKFCFFNTRVPTGRMAAGSGGKDSGYANINSQSIPSTYGEKIVEARRVISRPGKRAPDKHIPVGKQYLCEDIDTGELIAVALPELIHLKTQLSIEPEIVILPATPEISPPQIPEIKALSIHNPKALMRSKGQFLFDEVSDEDIAQFSQEGNMPTKQEADAMLEELDEMIGEPVTEKPKEKANDLLQGLDEVEGTPAPSVVDDLIAGVQDSESVDSGLDLSDVVEGAPAPSVSVTEILPEADIKVPESPAKVEEVDPVGDLLSDLDSQKKAVPEEPEKVDELQSMIDAL